MKFKTFIFKTIATLIATSLTTACSSYNSSVSFNEARSGAETKLIEQISTNEETPIPPTDSGLKLITYESTLGSMDAYISDFELEDNKKYPAIIWICGGFDNSIGDFYWLESSADNDQSASAFRKNGIVTMYPSLRGGNNNEGYTENLYGEIDDILCAYDYLSSLPYVDSKRIYLGGHSTGGTAALLTAEASDKFRAVFSFGPVSKITDYGIDDLTFDYSKKQERRLRSPIYWLNSINTPTYVFEGNYSGNSTCLEQMQRANKNSNINFFVVPNHDHFSVLSPLTSLISTKIINDTSENWEQSFTTNELYNLN